MSEEEEGGGPAPLTYVCDGLRHLVCLPYSEENLHRMARELGIGRHWYHPAHGRAHYDIPVRRRAEIESKCTRVTGREVLAIISGKCAPTRGGP